MKFKKLQQYLPEFVYGGIDGSVTTFAVVAGATGAHLESSVVIILGFANLIADGFSMSVGSYLSHKSTQHQYEKHRKAEYHEVKYNPEEGRQEIRDIYKEKGFEEPLLNEIVTHITADRELWVETMMKEELEMVPAGKSPFSMGLATFVSFNLVGLIPLLVYVLDYIHDLGLNLFVWSAAFTTVAFIIIGVLKSYINERSISRGIAETLSLGVIAAILAYAVGDLLKHIF